MKEGETTKRVFTGFLAIALLLGLLSVGASAAETKYKPLTMTLYSFATLTIDKARVTGEEDGYTIYGVPADAKATITVAGGENGFDFYIGAIFQLYSNDGDADTGRVRLESAECILNADRVLQCVFPMGERDGEPVEDNNWVGNPDYIWQNGTYSFTLNATDYVGWNFSILCGMKKISHVGSPDTVVHGYFLESYFGQVGDQSVFFVVEKAVGAASSIAPSTGTFTDVAAGSYCFDAVQWAVAQNITTGVTTTSFAPGETCTKAQILTFLWRANGQPEPAAANPFTDVTERDYFYKTALWAAEQGLVSGSAFGASAPCTRAMTVEYLWTLAGKPEAEKSTAFPDVPADAAYAKAVAWAVEQGVTTGKTTDTFAPDAVCTRGQIATFLHRAMG
ncbi:S-layer homology domain-containing protein [Oscillibacter sp.]|uniref:S-layer homology domain-containing protein n=1 Tax=Oscillibacter sp. TaxID=1945593 RepID=UPI0028A1A022|nr:S-layer homology domain-containing protein [Oscillibacter sp.]